MLDSILHNAARNGAKCGAKSRRIIMEIFPNWTAIPVIVLLIILALSLRRIFFIPMAQTLQERHHRIEGAREEAEQIKKSSAERLGEFDQRMRAARRES